jgi:hypothetical protein
MVKRLGSTLLLLVEPDAVRGKAISLSPEYLE